MTGNEEKRRREKNEKKKRKRQGGWRDINERKHGAGLLLEDVRKRGQKKSEKRQIEGADSSFEKMEGFHGPLLSLVWVAQPSTEKKGKKGTCTRST